MKKLIICCDGTWQRLSQQFPTNVSLTATAIAPVNQDRSPQMLFYDEGVGNARGVWPSLTSKFGGAFGSGLDDNIREAYRFLCANYDTDDQIFIFGFSRGGYTARSLCGLINHAGILKREELFREDQLIKEYSTRNSDPIAIGRFRKNYCRADLDSQPITYLGVWDTVGALGVPDMLPFANKWNRHYEYHDVSLVPAIKAGRHAVAIDETRNMFPVSLWTRAEIQRANVNSVGTNGERLFQQLWFAGDHGNVGGGIDDPRLSSISLIWVLDGALKAGLNVRTEFVNSIASRRERPPAYLKKESDSRPDFWGGLPYSIGGYSSRRGINCADDLHETAAERLRKKRDYRPKALSRDLLC